MLTTGSRQESRRCPKTAEVKTCQMFQDVSRLWWFPVWKDLSESANVQRLVLALSILNRGLDSDQMHSMLAGQVFLSVQHTVGLLKNGAG